MDDRRRVIVAELIVKVLQVLDDACTCVSQSTMATRYRFISDSPL
jgi:hypothetical protein